MTDAIEAVEPEVPTSLRGVLTEEYMRYFRNGNVPLVKALPITMYANHVTCEVGGVEKSIHIDDFTNMLELMSSGRPKVMNPISLPAGCFAFVATDTQINLSCYYPEVIREIKYKPNGNKEVSFVIPFPNLIITFTLKKDIDKMWVVQSANYFCTTKKITQLTDKEFIVKREPSQGIFRLPFPNVYGSDTMCYGENTMPARHNNNLRGLDYYYQFLFTSPFNNDLGVSGLTQSFTPEAWFKHLSKLGAFPYELLSK
jgi:hypothetical protein